MCCIICGFDGQYWLDHLSCVYRYLRGFRRCSLEKNVVQGACEYFYGPLWGWQRWRENREPTSCASKLSLVTYHWCSLLFVMYVANFGIGWAVVRWEEREHSITQSVITCSNGYIGWG